MQTTPCLWFDTSGEEAAQFYCSVVPHSRILRTTHCGDGIKPVSRTANAYACHLDDFPCMATDRIASFKSILKPRSKIGAR